MSIGWNFGNDDETGLYEAELYRAYGIDRDDERIRYYRALWELES